MTHMHAAASRFQFVVATILCIFAGAPGATAETPQEMDTLFAELAQPEGDAWQAAESDIIRIWSRSGSASADYLLKRGEAAIDQGDFGAAIGHLTALTDHAPDFAEGYAMRAAAFYLRGEFGPAMSDLSTTLRLEPRHWPAMTQLATMLEEMDQDDQAAEAYRQSLTINPHQQDAYDGLARLEQEMSGIGI